MHATNHGGVISCLAIEPCDDDYSFVLEVGDVCVRRIESESACCGQADVLHDVAVVVVVESRFENVSCRDVSGGDPPLLSVEMQCAFCLGAAETELA